MLARIAEDNQTAVHRGSAVPGCATPGLGIAEPQFCCEDERMAPRSELSAFLLSRRARLQPSNLGLPAGPGRRRTPGLRREEVAATAGVSVDYYTRLEQGRERHPSDAVLKALTGALLLNIEEGEHLLRLAAYAGGISRTHQADLPTRQLRPGVSQLLQTLGTAPAYVLNANNDLLAANKAGAALLADLEQWPASRRNTIRYIFLHPTARKLFVNWSSVARDAVAHLRTMVGLRPTDPELANLIEELGTKSEEFPRLWRLHDICSMSTGRKLFDHPSVGAMDLSYEVLAVSGAEQRLVVYQASAGTRDHDAMLLLTLGTQSSSPRPAVESTFAPET